MSTNRNTSHHHQGTRSSVRSRSLKCPARPRNRIFSNWAPDSLPSPRNILNCDWMPIRASPPIIPTIPCWDPCAISSRLETPGESREGFLRGPFLLSECTGGAGRVSSMHPARFTNRVIVTVQPYAEPDTAAPPTPRRRSQPHHRNTSAPGVHGPSRYPEGCLWRSHPPAAG